MQKGHSLLSVRYVADVDLVLSLSQRLAQQNCIGWVVIHVKDQRKWIHYSTSLPSREKKLYSDEHSGSHPDLTHIHTSARLKGA